MKTLIYAFAICGVLVACGADNKGPSNPELNYTLYGSTLTRDATPDIEEAQFTQLVQDNNQFALDLFQQLRNGSAQTPVASPLSISTALAMAYAGAGGETKLQMAQALQFNSSDALLHSGFNRLTAEMKDRHLPATDTLGAVDVQLVNAIWPVLGMTPAQAFLDTLAVNYGEGVYALDYKKDPDGSRRTINATVEQWTEGLITDLLPEGSINTLTEVVLTNTIYLKAPWQTPFPKQLTQPADFTNLDGTVSSVATMSSQAMVYYTADNDAEVLILPLRGEELEMAFIVPTAGTYTDYLDQADDMAEITGTLDAAPRIFASVQLPKFKHEFEASLVEPMQNLGMQDAFTRAADFTAMGLSEDLQITAIQHKAIVDVEESGVTAAAATAVVGGPTSVPMPVAVDRPFVYLIRDRTTSAILFLGAVTHLD